MRISRRSPISSPARTSLAAVLLGCCGAALAQDDAVTVTATRIGRPSLETPASVDRVHAEEIRQLRPQVNLSESLGRVPGIVVQNRQNYAQDLQLTSRGFGARSTFGIRGLRLVSDGIPASFPDGQGQVSHFDLGSVERIEVLRGPFSVLHGNASGGVVDVLTESGARFAAGARAGSGALSLGDFGSWRGAFKAGGRQAEADWLLSASRFHTDGFREHSAALREQLNARLALASGTDSSLSLVANAFASPETQDPLGLTRAQMNADPRQVVAIARTFDTRKSVRQDQLGAAWTRRLPESTLHLAVYGGGRAVRQYLAIPLATQAAATHSGGVVDLDRDYGGASLRLTRQAALFGRPFTLSLGGEYERMAERRRGFVNQNGSIAGLKRDEDDTVYAAGAYAQGEWRFAARWIALAGLRANRVGFRAEDHFIVPGNADDSGHKRYSAMTPVAGLLYRIAPAVSAYANAGRGFETPTFAELAHRTGGGGLNFGLQAARSRHLEAGIKAVLPAGLRATAALFDIATRDEIVIEASAGGRSTFKNAGRTRRRGIELGADASLPLGFEAALAWTRIEARFLDTFRSVAGTPATAVTVPAGSYLPGVPRSNLYAELRWRHAPSGFSAVLEHQRKARVWVDDRNSEAADAYGVTNLAAGYERQSGAWRLAGYLRLDNLAGRRYAGSVIVNDANLRFYEPAPGRAAMLGIEAKLGF
jgi:iron complex outermembrane receptor protein